MTNTKCSIGNTYSLFYKVLVHHFMLLIKEMLLNKKKRLEEDLKKNKELDILRINKG